jgi:hypothetical protein
MLVQNICRETSDYQIAFLKAINGPTLPSINLGKWKSLNVEFNDSAWEAYLNCWLKASQCHVLLWFCRDVAAPVLI